MGNKISFECDVEHQAYLPWFNKMEENNHPWVKSIILKPTGLPPIKVVEITPVYKEHRVKPDKYDFKIHRTNEERKDEKITIFFKKVVEKKKSTSTAEFTGELADIIELSNQSGKQSGNHSGNQSGKQSGGSKQVEPKVEKKQENEPTRDDRKEHGNNVNSINSVNKDNTSNVTKTEQFPEDNMV